MSAIFPPDRYRNLPISYDSGSCFVTVTDWKSSETFGSNVLPPHAYEKPARFVYDKLAFVSGAFTPTSKAAFYAGGFYKTSYDPDAPFLVQQKYWIGKNNQAMSWDIDSVYIDGQFATLISYADADPHTAPHDSLAVCALSTAITQTDYDAWSVAGFSNSTAIIGKKKLVVIKYNHAVGYTIAVYAILSTTPFNSGSVVRCYQRLLPDYDWSTSGYFFMVGFKTDAKTLVFWNRMYPTGGGLYYLSFANSYTTETRTKIGDTVYPQYNLTVTSSSFDDGAGNTGFDGNYNETLVSAGNTIVDVFQHKDDFTVIYKVELYHNNHQDVTDRTTPTSSSHLLNTSVFNQHNYHVHYVDWDSETVISANKIILTHIEKYTNAASMVDSVTTETQTIEQLDLDAKLIYANYHKQLYLYRTDIFTATSTFNGATGTQDESIAYNVYADHRGIVTLIDSYTNTLSKTITASVINQWSYSPTSGDFYYDANFYYGTRHAAYDNKLVLCCFNLHWTDLNTIDTLHQRPRTLIYKNKDEFQLLDYRVDYSGNGREYPITVTSKKAA